MAGTTEGAIKAWDKIGRKNSERGEYARSSQALQGSGSSPTQLRQDWNGDSDFEETTDYESFISARDKHPLRAFMSPVSAADLRERRVFLSKDKRTGYTIDKNGDFGNLFNLPGGMLGAGSKAIVEAISKHGAKTLDCYDGALTNLYAKHGFVPVARLKFNREYAPPGWDYERFDSPDVVFMRYKGGDRRTIGRRIGKFGGVNLDGVRQVEDYDSGQAAAAAAEGD